MKTGIKNHSMLSGGGSLVPVAPAVFGNKNPATAHISRRTEASLPGRPLLREVINRNSTDLHRNGSNAERFGICGSFISCNERTGTIIPVVLLSSLTCCFVVVRFYDLLLFWRQVTTFNSRRKLRGQCDFSEKIERTKRIKFPRKLDKIVREKFNFSSKNRCENRSKPLLDRVQFLGKIDAFRQVQIKRCKCRYPLTVYPEYPGVCNTAAEMPPTNPMRRLR